MNNVLPNFLHEGDVVVCVREIMNKECIMRKGEVGFIKQASMTWFAVGFGDPAALQSVTCLNEDAERYFTTVQESNGQNPLLDWYTNWQAYQQQFG